MTGSNTPYRLHSFHHQLVFDILGEAAKSCGRSGAKMGRCFSLRSGIYWLCALGQVTSPA